MMTKGQDDKRNAMLEAVRKRIFDAREEDALFLLDGRRFAVANFDGENVDPWQLTEEERLQWMQMVHDSMSDIREQGRLADFTRAWAGFDKEHRDHLLDGNSSLFAGSRIDYMKSLTDGECAWIVGAQSWQICDLLTDHGPFYGNRPVIEGSSLANDGIGNDAAHLPSPSFAVAA